MNQTMNSVVKNILRRASWIATTGLLAVPAIAGDLRIGINIAVPQPPVVVVREEPVVYERFVVGYRRNLYDADLALRLARAEEFTAYDELQAARRHEADVAVSLDGVEALIADLRHRIGDHAADPNELHA